ncbi:MAG: hypothetical protein HKM97_05060 [Acidimicrobiia bacterium]|nr:hypothetical protein [Acidimicrobiia bacterium]
MSTSLLEQLRRYGEDFEAAQTEIPLDRLKDPPVAIPTISRRRGLAVAVAAAVALLVLIGGAFLFGGPFGGDEQPPVVTKPEQTPLPAFIPAPGLDSWQQVGADLMYPVVGLFDMTQAGPWLVAVGFDPGGDMRQDGVILASRDGRYWIRFAENDPALTTGTVLIYGIVQGGPGLVAVGMSCEDAGFPCETGPHPTVWTSVDATSWTRTPHDPDLYGELGSMEDIVATDDGIVAVGVIEAQAAGEGTSTSAVWLSVDGLEWSRVWDGVPGTYLLGVAARPDGVIVGVGGATDQSGATVGAAWVSTGPDQWERVDQSSTAFTSPTGLDVVILDVAAGPAGFTAVGSEGSSLVAVWRSVDGRSWTRVDTADQPFGDTGTLASIAAVDSGWIAGGPDFSSGFGPATLWTSPDGLTWHRVSVLDSQYVSAVVATDAGTAAVAGARRADNDNHAAVWVGPTFDPNVPPPDPGSDSPIASASLEAGLSCEELASAGLSYARAVVYGMRHALLADLDPDEDGIPCESAYPSAEVAEVFHDPEGPAVRIVSDLPNLRFTATGPAVEAGLMCPAGTTEFTHEPKPTRMDALFRWEDIYRCDDGSGSFTLGVDVFVDLGDRGYGIWDIASRPGTNQSLTGGGWTDTAVDVSDVSVGRIVVGTGGG